MPRPHRCPAQNNIALENVIIIRSTGVFTTKKRLFPLLGFPLLGLLLRLLPPHDLQQGMPAIRLGIRIQPQHDIEVLQRVLLLRETTHLRPEEREEIVK